MAAEDDLAGELFRQQQATPAPTRQAPQNVFDGRTNAQSEKPAPGPLLDAGPHEEVVKYFSETMDTQIAVPVQVPTGIPLTKDERIFYASQHEKGLRQSLITNPAGASAYAQAGNVLAPIGGMVDLANQAAGIATSDPGLSNMGPLVPGVDAAGFMRQQGNMADQYGRQAFRQAGGAAIDLMGGRPGDALQTLTATPDMDALRKRANPPPPHFPTEQFIDAVFGNVGSLAVGGMSPAKANAFKASLQTMANNLASLGPGQLQKGKGLIAAIGQAMQMGMETGLPAAGQAFAQQIAPNDPMAPMWGDLVASFGVGGAMRLVDEGLSRIGSTIRTHTRNAFGEDLRANTSGAMQPYGHNLTQAENSEAVVNQSLAQMPNPVPPLDYTLGQATGELGHVAMEGAVSQEMPGAAQAQQRLAQNRTALETFQSIEQPPENLQVTRDKVEQGLKDWQSATANRQIELNEPLERFTQSASQLPSHGESFDRVQSGIKNIDNFRRQQEFNIYSQLDQRFTNQPLDISPVMDAIAEVSHPQIVENANRIRSATNAQNTRAIAGGTAQSMRTLTSRVSRGEGPGATPSEFTYYLQNMHDSSNWRELRNLRSGMLKAREDFERMGETGQAGKVRQVIKKIDDFIDAQMGIPAQQGNAMAFRSANLETQAMREVLLDSPLGGMIATGNTGYGFRMSSDKVVEKILSDRQSAQMFNAMLNRMSIVGGGGAAGDIAQLQSDFIAGARRYLYESTVNPDTGDVVNSKLQAFTKKFKDGLQEFPQLEAEARDLARHGQVAQEFRDGSMAAQKMFDESAARLLVGEHPDSAIQRIMSGTKSKDGTRTEGITEELRRLVSLAGDDLGAKRGLRRSMFDWMKANAVPNGEDFMNGPIPDGKMLKQMVEAFEPQLRLSGLYDKDHLELIKRVAEGFEIMQRSMPVNAAKWTEGARRMLFTEGQIGSRIYGIQRGWYKERWLATEGVSRLIIRRLGKMNDDEMIKLMNQAMFDKQAAKAFLTLSSPQSDNIVAAAFKRVLPGFAARLLTRDVPQSIKMQPPPPAPTPPPPR